jgi:hypothetical protein
MGAEWWTWAVQAPASDNPLLDATGEDCRVGQRGPVWFLATTLGSGQQTLRHCEVPAGKAIFFPAINNVWFSFLNDPPATRTPAAVRAALNSVCSNSSIRGLSVTIDGKAVRSPARFATTAEQSPLFEAQLPTDNVLGLTEADATDLLMSPSVHKGFYYYVLPLRPGPHTIHWTATWDCDFGAGPQAASEDITYELTVLPGVAGQE